MNQFEWGPSFEDEVIFMLNLPCKNGTWNYLKIETALKISFLENYLLTYVFDNKLVFPFNNFIFLLHRL